MCELPVLTAFYAFSLNTLSIQATCIPENGRIDHAELNNAILLRDVLENSAVEEG